MHYFSPDFYPPFAPGFMLAFLPFLIVIAIWSLVLKGFALWHAARGSQKWWFVAMLVINSVGILEIIYLIWFRPGASGLRRSHKTPAESSSPQA